MSTFFSSSCIFLCHISTTKHQIQKTSTDTFTVIGIIEPNCITKNKPRSVLGGCDMLPQVEPQPPFPRFLPSSRSSLAQSPPDTPPIPAEPPLWQYQSWLSTSGTADRPCWPKLVRFKFQSNSLFWFRSKDVTFDLNFAWDLNYWDMTFRAKNHTLDKQIVIMLSKHFDSMSLTVLFTKL